MRCNGAGLARFYEWKVKRPGPLIAVVIRKSTCSVNSRPTKPLPRPFKAAVITAMLLVALAVTTHLVARDARESILSQWLFLSLFVSIGPVVYGRGYSSAGVACTFTSHWFALAYCSDMGGPYSHGILAGLVGASALFSTLVISIIGFVRLIAPKPRPKIPLQQITTHESYIPPAPSSQLNSDSN